MTPSIVNLLFEAQMLKHIPRTGYAFLGAGRETVAEHSFLITFVAMMMVEMAAETEPDIDRERLLRMCLVHDLPEARISDLNYVHKRYNVADEDRAMQDAMKPFSFGEEMLALLREFNACRTREARLARDADQLAFLLDLKALSDTGHKGPEKWIPPMLERLNTDIGRQLAETILNTPWDDWWFKNCIDNSHENQ